MLIDREQPRRRCVNQDRAREIAHDFPAVSYHINPSRTRLFVYEKGGTSPIATYERTTNNGWRLMPTREPVDDLYSAIELADRKRRLGVLGGGV